MASSFLGFTPVSFLAILPGLLVFVFVIASLRAYREAPAGRLLILLCLCLMSLALGYSLAMGSSTGIKALVWIKFAVAALLLLPALGYLFNVSFLTAGKPPPPSIFLLMGITILLETVHLLSGSFVAGTYPYSWGYFPRFQAPFLAFIVYFLFVLVLILRDCWRAYREAPPGPLRSRNRLLLIAWSLATVGSLDFLSGFGLPLIPMGAIPLSASILVSFIILSRHGMPDYFQYAGISSILQSISDPTFLIDNDGRVRYMDTETAIMLGHQDAESLTDMPINSLFSPGTPLFRQDRLEAIARGEKIPSLVLGLYSCSGESIPVRFRISGVFNNSRQLIGLIASGRDIRDEIEKEEDLVCINRNFQDKIHEVEQRTEELTTANRALEDSRRAMMNILEDMEESHRRLEEAYQRLEEVDRSKDAFLSSVSHELRTPLTSIRSFSEILLDYPLEEQETQREFLGIIHQESERLTRLVNDLLDLAKIQSGRIQWHRDRVDIADLFQAATQNFSVLTKEKELKVSLQVQDHLPPLQVDKDKIYQVVCNLLTNSIEFTPAGGSVSLSARKLDGGAGENQGHTTVMIQVADTGKGIEKDNLEQICEKFHQCGDTIKEKPRGTGLGLSICKEIIQHYGGSIWAESEEGKGTRMSFTLPVSENPP